MRKPAVLVALALMLGAGAAHADGDPAAGKEVFKKCVICHSTDENVNKLGPSLYGVVGRPSGSIADYHYSDAMKAANKVWDAKTLDVYLADPKGTVPGTKMIFAGLKDSTDRANVIAYLATLK